MRTRIATDLHDEIGANLMRIALLSEVARATRGRGRRRAARARSLASPASRSSSMSDIVWAVSPERESLLDLTRRMRQHADEVFTPRDIELRLGAPVPAEDVRLGVDVRREMLIFKEAVNNVARHSRCSLVRMTGRWRLC